MRQRDVAGGSGTFFELYHYLAGRLFTNPIIVEAKPEPRAVAQGAADMANEHPPEALSGVGTNRTGSGPYD